MIYIDTNILLRLIFNDHDVQVQKIITFFNRTSKTLLVPSLVMMEVYQVLTGKRIDLSNNEASNVLLSALFNIEKITIEESSIHKETLNILKKKKIDYVDAYLTVKCTQEQQQVLSFDKDFDKLDKTVRIKL